MKKIIAFIALCSLFLASVAFAFPAPAARNGFSNMNVTTEYSELLKEKNARNDSLLPALDGDKAFAEVLRLNPNFWSLGSAMEKEGSLVTKLNAQIVFIDGIREEPYCEIIKNSEILVDNIFFYRSKVKPGENMNFFRTFSTFENEFVYPDRCLSCRCCSLKKLDRSLTADKRFILWR